FAAFTIADRDTVRSVVASVPRGQLPAFLALLDRGRLDGVLRDSLDSSGTGPPLERAEQTATAGLYASLRASPWLLPPDRKGVGPGKRGRLPAFGSESRLYRADSGLGTTSR